jgi:hypothetical protein
MVARVTRAARTRAMTPADAAVAIDAVVTHHRDGFRSGVARFNELLAEHLGVPLLGLHDTAVEDTRCPLFSFKVSELPDADARHVVELVTRSDWHGELYLHDWSDLELEYVLARRARRVHCGNLEIQARISRINPNTQSVWTPGLILDQRAYVPVEISLFSFGMAHKIRTDMFRRLRELLDASGRSYAIYVSAANHETASLRDAQVVFEEMREIFPRLYFLGNLSDVAVCNELRRATFFASFFPSGVRANNTSIAAALELGAVVITNLDEFSPPEFRHMENLIDIGECDELPVDPLVLRRLSVGAMETGRARSWSSLIQRLAPH